MPSGPNYNSCEVPTCGKIARWLVRDTRSRLWEVCDDHYNYFGTASEGATIAPRAYSRREESMATLHKVEGGGTRSEKAPAYHLVPPEGPRRIAKRFGLGAEIHGPDNWKRSCERPEDALAWCQEAYNHMQEHAAKMIAGTHPEDDHVGAIGWAVCIFAYVEDKFRMPWTDLKGLALKNLTEKGNG